MGAAHEHDPMSTMADVEAAISQHLDALKQHPFLLRLEDSADIGQLRALLGGMAFFTLAFQDMLRVAREQCTDPTLVEVARTLELGDKGHDAWYLEDLDGLGVPLSVGWLFSQQHAVARDVSYALISELISQTDDRARLAIMLSLESSAREFFKRVPGFAERAGVRQELKYFGPRHLEAEEAHEVFDREHHDDWSVIEVEDEAVPGVLRAVERTFQVLARLGDDLDVAMGAASANA
jgi:hypothetical protein